MTKEHSTHGYHTISQRVNILTDMSLQIPVTLIEYVLSAFPDTAATYANPITNFFLLLFSIYINLYILYPQSNFLHHSCYDWIQILLSPKFSDTMSNYIFFLSSVRHCFPVVTSKGRTHPSQSTSYSVGQSNWPERQPVIAMGQIKSGGY